MKNYQQSLFAIIGSATMLLGSSHAAQATTFNFSGLTGLLNPQIQSSFSFQEDGIDLIVTGFSTNGPEDVSLQIDGLGVFSGGLDPLQVDGIGPDETLSLLFDPSVIINSATFARVGSNDDVEITVDGDSIYNGDIPNFLGFGTITIDDAPSGVMINFAVTENNDGFLLKKVDVSAVPEPLTILGAGTAIAFGAKFKRKLAKAKKK